MRVLCCHAIADDGRRLRPETREALEQHATSRGHDVEIVDCTGKQTLYHETLEQYWAEQQDWVNVEHDVVIHEEVLHTFDRCPWPWCAYLTELSCGYTAGALGCVRFRTLVMQAEPNAMTEAGKADQSGVVAKAWYRTDVRLDLHLRHAGYLPHIHGRVEHLNDKQKLAEPDRDYIGTLERSGFEFARALAQHL